MAKFKSYEINSQCGADDDGNDIIWIDIYEVNNVEEEDSEEGINICEIDNEGNIKYSKINNWQEYMDDICLLEKIIYQSKIRRKLAEDENGTKR